MAGEADKANKGGNVDERFDPLHAATMRWGEASFPDPRQLLGSPLARGRRELVGRDYDHFNLRRRLAGSIAVGAMKKMADRIACNERGPGPLHLDMAGRANGRF